MRLVATRKWGVALRMVVDLVVRMVVVAVFHESAQSDRTSSRLWLPDVCDVTQLRFLCSWLESRHPSFNP